MKKFFVTALAVMFTMGVTAAKKVPAKLQFDPSKGVAGSVTMPQGDIVNYTAFTKLYFVTNVEDSTYQYMNVFVPAGATQQSPIFLRTYIGGYMAAQASFPQGGDATGRALKEGYVVVIPGSRGRGSIVQKGKKTIYTGRAPKGLLDLKAAVRYLRLFDKVMSGDAEKIITDGTSAGGAMSSLVGATGNNLAYDKYLKAMGAADTRDDVFASVCYCPITDLDHADMAYEWLYGGTTSRQQADDAHKTVSGELAQLFPAYINSLNLKKSDGSALNADNYLDDIKSEIIRSAQIAKNAGADIPDSIGFTFSQGGGFGMPPLNGGKFGPKGKQGGMMPPAGMRDKKPEGMPPMMRGGGKQVGEYITDLDMPKYLNYVASTQPLKSAPAFDAKGVASNTATGENEEFGDETGSSVNFTDYSATKNRVAVTPEVREAVRLLNPMCFIGDSQTTVAPHWYIRHGARDRDTAFPIAINLATKLQNAGKDVNFLLAWNRPHSGDYALDELFAWIKTLK
jgi:hypothetical protein